MKHKKSVTCRFVLTIVIIFVVVFALSLWIQIKTYQDVEKLSTSLKEMHAMVNAEAYDKSLEAYYDIRDLWNSHKDHWYYYLNHTIIKETDLSIARMGAYLESEQYGDAIAEEAALLRLLHEVKSHDIPLLHNFV